MDETIITNIISPLKPKDEFFFLGDLSWSHETTFKFFERFPKDVKFHWILGNHEKGWEQFKKNCSSISSISETKIGDNSVILCHYPMITWNKSHYNSWQLFGHHHMKSNGWQELENKVVGKALNVNIEFHNYKPWSEEEIIEYMSHRQDNWDLIK